MIFHIERWRIIFCFVLQSLFHDEHKRAVTTKVTTCRRACTHLIHSPCCRGSPWLLAQHMKAVNDLYVEPVLSSPKQWQKSPPFVCRLHGYTSSDHYLKSLLQYPTRWSYPFPRLPPQTNQHHCRLADTGSTSGCCNTFLSPPKGSCTPWVVLPRRSWMICWLIWVMASGRTTRHWCSLVLLTVGTRSQLDAEEACSGS